MRWVLGVVRVSVSASIGCRRSSEPPPVVSVPPPPDTPSTPVGPGSSPTEPPVDCASPANAPTVQPLDAPRGYHDLVFDADGYVIGSDGDALIRSDGVTFEVIAAGLGELDGIELLPNGDLVAASPETRSLVRIDPDGAVWTIATDVPAYSLALGPDGDLWTAGYGETYRVDPDTGERTPGLDANGRSLRAITAAADGRMYGVSEDNDCYGIVLAFSFDADGSPLPDPEWVWSPWDDADERALLCVPDGIAVDACGNVYVEEYVGLTLYRITPDKVVDPYVAFGFEDYGHGLTWGSGVGPWGSDALYLPQPNRANHAVEVVVGVPGAPGGW